MNIKCFFGRHEEAYLGRELYCTRCNKTIRKIRIDWSEVTSKALGVFMGIFFSALVLMCILGIINNSTSSFYKSCIKQGDIIGYSTTVFNEKCYYYSNSHWMPLP